VKRCGECAAARGTKHEVTCHEGVWGRERRKLREVTKLKGRGFRVQFAMLMAASFGIPSHGLIRRGR